MYNCIKKLNFRKKRMGKITSRDRPKSAPYPRLKNRKRTSKCHFTVLENRKSKKYKPSGAPGPASASPWRAKRGTLPKLSTFLSQLKGGPFGEKTNFRKKVSQCRKTERGTFWGFSTSILSQNIKNLKGKFLFSGKKSHSAEKNRKRGPFWIFQHPFCRKTAKKLKGDPSGKFFFRKKVSQCRKKLKGGTLWSHPVWYVTGKTFLVQFVRPNSEIWCNNIL